MQASLPLHYFSILAYIDKPIWRKNVYIVCRRAQEQSKVINAVRCVTFFVAHSESWFSHPTWENVLGHIVQNKEGENKVQRSRSRHDKQSVANTVSDHIVLQWKCNGDLWCDWCQFVMVRIIMSGHKGRSPLESWHIQIHEQTIGKFLSLLKV